MRVLFLWVSALCCERLQEALAVRFRSGKGGRRSVKQCCPCSCTCPPPVENASFLSNTPRSTSVAGVNYENSEFRDKKNDFSRLCVEGLYCNTSPGRVEHEALQPFHEGSVKCTAYLSSLSVCASYSPTPWWRSCSQDIVEGLVSTTSAKELLLSAILKRLPVSSSRHPPILTVLLGRR